MKKWYAALLLSITLGVFAGSGIACGASSGCVNCGDKQGSGSTDSRLTSVSRPKITLTGAKATWSEVEGATGYVYKIGSKGEETKVDSPVEVMLKNGDKLYVKALGDGVNTKDSSWATKTCEVELTPLSAPTNVTFDDFGGASWSAVDGAASYTYIVRDASGKELSKNTTKQCYTSIALEEGQTIEVMANGNGETTSNSGYSEKVTCPKVKDSSQQGGVDNEKPEDVVDPDDIVPGEVYDETKLGNILNIDNINWNTPVEVGSRADIPIVYAKYDGAYRKAFAWVTRGNGEVVEVVSRGTRFLVDTMEEYTVEYYINVGGPQKIAERKVTVKDTQGPTFKLPASADGMLAYANKPLTLPDATAYDYSYEGGSSASSTTVSVKYQNGSKVTVTNGTFTPTQFGNYTVTYTATDALGNVASTSYTVNCVRMVEICNFDSEDVAGAWQYYEGEETLGTLSTEERYGDTGSSLKVTTRGTGNGGFIKVWVQPNYFDLSGFDEIAFYIWCSAELSGPSAGVYLLNNEAKFHSPINLKKGENIVRFTRDELSLDYFNADVMQSSKMDYRSSDHIWLQFRGPENVNMYIDNMVGIFNSDNKQAPMLDVGAGAAIAGSKDESGETTYQGAYGNISVYEGETIKSAIEKNVHACYSENPNLAYSYTVKLNGADVTNAVKSGTQKGTFGEKYNLTVSATANGKTTTKTTQIVVRQKFPTYDLTGKEEYTLSYFNALEDVTAASESTKKQIKLKYDVSSNGNVDVKVIPLNETLYVKLTLPDENNDGARRALKVSDVELMEYINIKALAHNSGPEIALGNGTALCRMRTGWNDITIDKATLIKAMNDGTYDATTGMLALKVHSPLQIAQRIVFYRASAVYAQGNMPYEKELPLLNTPSVEIDPSTGVASWEAVDNAIGYIVRINGVEKPMQTTTSYALNDSEAIEVKAIADGTNYADGAYSAKNTYYDGKVLLNNCDDLIYFDTATTESLSDKYVLEGNWSTKLVSTENWQVVYIYLRINDKVLSKEQWKKYEYVEFNIYAETAGQQLYLKNTSFATLKQGWNTVQLTTKMLLEEWDADEKIYSNDGGFLWCQFASAGHTVYFDKIMGVIGNGSAYVEPDEGGSEDEEVVENTLLNDGSNANFGIAGATLSIDSAHATEGTTAIKGVLTGWSTWLLPLLKNGAPLTTTDWAKYSYIEFDLYSEDKGSIYFNGVFLQTLVVGENKIRISTDTIISAMNAGKTGDFDPYNMGSGALWLNIALETSGKAVWIDNVVAYVDGEVAGTTEDLLNDCDSVNGKAEWGGVAGGYLGGTVSTTNMVQGGASLSAVVSTTVDKEGNYWTTWLMYLKKNGVAPTLDQISQYEYIEITVWTQCDGIFSMYGEEIQALQTGKNVVKINSTDFVRIAGTYTGEGLKPYDTVSGYANFNIIVKENGTTIWVDNIKGVYPTA